MNRKRRYRYEKKLRKFLETDKQIKEFMGKTLLTQINAENLIPVTFEFEKKGQNNYS